MTVCRRNGEILFHSANAPEGPVKVPEKDRLGFFGHYGFGRFSPDGKIVAVVTSDRPEEVRLYDSENGRSLRRLALDANLVRLAFSPDGRQLATTERDSAVRLYEVATGKRLWSHTVKLDNPYENYTSAIAFSPDGKMIAAGATDHAIYLLDASTGNESGRLIGHAWYPWTLAFTADSARLYSSGWDPPIRCWDVAARKQVTTATWLEESGATAASPDGRLLAFADDRNAIHLVGATDGTEQRTLELPGTKYSRLAFSPNSRRIAGGGEVQDQVHVAVWDVATGGLLHRWDWPKGRDPHSTVESLHFSPDGDRLAAAVFRQSAAYVWDLKAGAEIANLTHKRVYGLSFSPDGKTLATAGWDSFVRLWNTEDWQTHREFEVKDEAGGRRDMRMYDVCFSPAGGWLATAHMDNAVSLWQADGLLLRRRINTKSGFVSGTLAFSADGLWLATGTTRGSVAVWDPTTGQPIWNKGRHDGYVLSVGFGHDSRNLLTGGREGAGYLWDLRPPGLPSGKEIPQLWTDLSSDDSRIAFQAMCELAEMPDRTIPLVAEKLRPVRIVLDLDRTEPEVPAEEALETRRRKRLLADKDPKVALSIVVRRAIAILAQIATPEALAALRELATQNPQGEVGKTAAAALLRTTASAN